MKKLLVIATILLVTFGCASLKNLMGPQTEVHGIFETVRCEDGVLHIIKDLQNDVEKGKKILDSEQYMIDGLLTNDETVVFVFAGTSPDHADINIMVVGEKVAEVDGKSMYLFQVAGSNKRIFEEVHSNMIKYNKDGKL